ncbi:MAG: hypothetical protein JXX28_16235 [Deltaproteobacteria bacterium]|nr:hypothetical protein [Deltaproteobacteria bacterium]
MTSLVLLADEPLAAHTAHRTGGACALLAVAHREHALGDAIRAVSAVSPSWRPLGAGTRVVAKDGEHPGALLRLGSDYQRVTVEEHGLTVGAALPLPALYAIAARLGFAGLPAMQGVGSVGASLVLDVWGEEVSEVSYLWRGRPQWGALEQARRSRLILGVRFSLRAGRPEVLGRKLRRRLGEGGLSSWYPWSARLRRQLARVTVPGVRVHTVWVPPAAPEMLVNLGGATAEELALVHRSVQDRVRKLRGEEIGSAVQWLGR